MKDLQRGKGALIQYSVYQYWTESFKDMKSDSVLQSWKIRAIGCEHSSPSSGPFQQTCVVDKQDAATGPAWSQSDTSSQVKWPGSVNKNVPGPHFLKANSSNTPGEHK